MRYIFRSLLIQVAARRLARRQKPVEGQPQNILLIRPDHLGDVLFLTPALRALRVAQPEAKITVLVGGWAKDLLVLNPDVNEVETLDFPWFNRKAKGGLLTPYKQLQAEANALRSRFDTAIICRFDHWWGAWLAGEAGIPRIIGYDLPDVRPFLSHQVHYTPGQHEVLQNLKLTSLLGTPSNASPETLPLRYEITGAHRLKVRQLLNESGLYRAQGPLVAIHPGSGARVKRWDNALWGRLMDLLRERYGFQFIITGGPDEILLASRVKSSASEETPVASMAGETSLPELAALFERCELVIGPDSGPLHLAVAMKRPTLHLYGPVDPHTFGPWGQRRQRVISQSLSCQPCNRLDWTKEQLPYHPCIIQMPFSMVVEGIEQVVREAMGES